MARAAHKLGTAFALQAVTNPAVGELGLPSQAKVIGVVFTGAPVVPRTGELSGDAEFDVTMGNDMFRVTVTRVSTGDNSRDTREAITSANPERTLRVYAH